MTTEKLLKFLREAYRGSTKKQTAKNLDLAVSQVKLAEFCRQLGIGVKKYKSDAISVMVDAIHR